MTVPESQSTPPPGWQPATAPVWRPDPTPRHQTELVAARTAEARSPIPPLLLAAAFLIAGVLVIVLLVSGSSATTSLQGTGFSTAYPSGWSEHVRTSAQGSEYMMGSHDSTLDPYGIPMKGQVGLTIEVASLTASNLSARLSAELEQKAAADPIGVLQSTVGVPPGSAGEVMVAAPHTTTLDGQPAGQSTVSYVYDGVTNVQTDVAAVHDGVAALIEVDSDPAFSSQANSALQVAVSHWNW